MGLGRRVRGVRIKVLFHRKQLEWWTLPRARRPHTLYPSDSRYGLITFATRQIFAAAQIMSMVAFFCRNVSRSASRAISRPILWRNLKQSATVLAGVKTGTSIPSILYFTTPNRRVSGEKRTTRSFTLSTLGVLAFCPIAIHTSKGDCVVRS